MNRIFTNRILGIALALVFLGSGVHTAAAPSAPPFSLPSCLQDQYGNQYQNLKQDYVHNIVTGTPVSGQSCTDSALTMVGSWATSAGGDTVLELTVASSDLSGCVPIYKLKGTYPTSQWYYDAGLEGNQQFRYAACSGNSAVVPDNGTPGTHGMRKY